MHASPATPSSPRPASRDAPPPQMSFSTNVNEIGRGTLEAAMWRPRIFTFGPPARSPRIPPFALGRDGDPSWCSGGSTSESSHRGEPSKWPTQTRNIVKVSRA